MNKSVIAAIDALETAFRTLDPGTGPLRTSHLRYKPGVSVVARVDVGTTGSVHWVAAYAPAGNGRPELLAFDAIDGKLTFNANLTQAPMVA